MKRRHRLGGRRAVDAVRSRRASASAGSLRLHLAPGPSSVMRVAFAVPRAAGGAVVRNRIRRRLRPLLAARAAELAGCDLVISAGTAVATQAAPSLAGDLDVCIDRARRRL